MASLAHFKVPAVENEPNLHYLPGSAERKAVDAAIAEYRKAGTLEVPCFVGGKEVKTGKLTPQKNPGNYAEDVATAHQADEETVKLAMETALGAKREWEDMPWNDRAAIFLKAADLISGKYRAKIVAATMLGQGKNYWQAEIDAAAELIDFLRFGVKYAEEVYSIQPPKNSKGIWNRVEYRPLDGFVLAITPFNFTAIAGNLPAAPAMLGNVVLWKPSPLAILSNYLVLEILHEAGLPKNVIQFIPGPPEMICNTCFQHPDFAGLHFTGSTSVFKHLWKEIAQNIDTLKSYPRIVGETGGKNFHLIHPSADIQAAVLQSIRAGFEYQGQKCSALSRAYVPESVWPEFKNRLQAECKKITLGNQEESHFMGPVISKQSYDKITSMIEKAKKAGGELIAGGGSDMSTGFMIEPTVVLTKEPKSITMVEEIFGPVITVYVYPDSEFEETCKLIDETTSYALTGAVFAQDRAALVKASALLRSSAGNFYINDKCTGAVVGQQPFGGARGSGTNDKAGGIYLTSRFMNPRSIKENFIHPETFLYPSNAQ